MPVLADILSYGNTVRRKLGDLLRDPIGVAQMNLDRVLPTDYESRQSYEAQRGRPANPVAVADARKKLEQMYQDAALGAITVWHGSPHKFDKFDMSKIGTGEGSQAYGHGLYFAENPSVARTYSGITPDFFFADKPVPKKDLPTAKLIHTHGSVDDTINFLRNKINEDAQAAKATSSDFERSYYDLAQKQSEKIISDLQQKKWRSMRIDDKGNLYKTDIPDEAVARFLDWDKPLSQQAPEVQAALQQAAALRAKQTGGAFGPLDMQQLGKDLVPTMGEGRLKQSGIPGIRYLDGGSRGAGTGTSNFVVFDDQLPTILERNGVPLSTLLNK